MRHSDHHIKNCKALVIDANPTSRSSLINILRDMGVGHVSQTSRIVDARQELESRVFDIVVCDYHFDNATISGQELLDDLRQSQLLPFSTVFIMVTGECSYIKVAEAAESALDGYLVKPHTAIALEERVIAARHRKRVLGYIFEAIQAEQYVEAAEMCMARYEAREEFWLYAARMGAELFLRVGDHESAKRLYAAVNESKALPWSKLGLARAELESGEVPKATRILESLIAEEPSYVDAYDVMSRIQLEQGDMQGAMATYRDSLRVTPHSIPRLQKQGMLAFFSGEKDEALKSLDRTVRLGLKSKMFDAQTLVLLCMLYFDKRDAKEFNRIIANLEQMLSRRPDSVRLQRFMGICRVFHLLTARKVGECVSLVRELASETRAEDFDFECATNFLAMLGRLRNTEIQLPDAEMWVEQTAKRFCVSKAASELLCKAAGDDVTYCQMIREGLHSINMMAEEALSHRSAGRPARSVETLLVRGLETGNAKLIELANNVLTRHAAKIENTDSLTARINELKSRYCSRGTKVSLGQVKGRAAGGLNLRVQ